MDRGVSLEQRSRRRPKSASVLDRFPENRRDLEIASSLNVTLDAYWDLSDMERSWHERRWGERRAQCQHCGRSREECSDPNKVWYPQREVCYATMEREAANAAYVRLHSDHPWHEGNGQSWAERGSKDHPYRYDFGVTVGVADSNLRPDDLFTTHEVAPLRPIDSEQATPAEAVT